MTDTEIIDEILTTEGGFVNHPADHGKATNFGITLATLATWRGRPVSPEDVRQMPVTEARAIYQAQYVTPWAWVTDDRLRVFLVDYGVHAGIGGAVTGLQLALISLNVSLTIDGSAGPKTQAAVAKTDPDLLYYAVVKHRLLELSQRALLEPQFRVLMKHGPPLQAAFLLGWIRRVAKFL